MSRRIHVQYFAVLRERAGRSEETCVTGAATPAELYAELQAVHGFALPRSMLRVAVNEAFSDWSRPLAEGDRVVFIPPVAGG
jgi:molybdopterin converting factor subunit 1